MVAEDRTIFALPEVRRTLELVGLTAILWNRVELLWYLIYTCLLHGIPRNKIDRIYQYFITGAAKRDFALHLAEIALPADQLEWAKKLADRTGELAGLRNAIVHADYWFDMLNGPPSLKISRSSDHNRRPNRFATKKALVPEIEAITEQISTHAEELDEFRGYLVQNCQGDGPKFPLPEKHLKAMSADIRAALPKELREVIALRKFPKKNGKRPRRPKC